MEQKQLACKCTFAVGRQSQYLLECVPPVCPKGQCQRGRIAFRDRLLQAALCWILSAQLCLPGGPS